MRFNRHWELEGKHAFLSPSQYHWVNYTDQKLVDRYFNHLAVEKGTRLHALAKELIELGIYLPDIEETLNLYVNDAIYYSMVPEQPLYYSVNCFGTADAISFEEGFLRIHDLKTGVTPANMTQLSVYAALFCLEYDLPPGEIETELRIYQSDKVIVHNPHADEIAPIIDTIIYFDKKIEELKYDQRA